MAANKSCTGPKTFIWLQVICVLALANDLTSADTNVAPLNISTSLEDYIAQLEYQYASVISRDEAIIEDFRVSYEKQLTAIDAQSVFIETELIATDKKYYTLQFLNDISKHCVQKYRQLLYTTAAVRQNFNSCLSSARSYLTSILSSVTTNVRNLNNFFYTNFKNGVTDCKRKNINSYTNQTICVVNLNNQIAANFRLHQGYFNTNLDTAKCSADTRIRATVECVFKTVNASLVSIGATSSSIDGCISGLESCAPCQDQNGNGNSNDTAIIVPQPQCPNVINVISGYDVYHNATIRNPFVNLNSTLDCILVNFLRPN